MYKGTGSMTKTRYDAWITVPDSSTASTRTINESAPAANFRARILFGNVMGRTSTWWGKYPLLLPPGMIMC